MLLEIFFILKYQEITHTNVIELKLAAKNLEGQCNFDAISRVKARHTAFSQEV
jgi:hypothetical protein